MCFWHIYWLFFVVYEIFPMGIIGWLLSKQYARNNSPKLSKNGIKIYLFAAVCFSWDFNNLRNNSPFLHIFIILLHYLRDQAYVVSNQIFYIILYPVSPYIHWFQCKNWWKFERTFTSDWYLLARPSTLILNGAFLLMLQTYFDAL